MAGPSVKEILLKLNLDVSGWRKAIQDLSGLLLQQQQKSTQAQTLIEKSLATQKASITSMLDTQKAQTSELQRQVQLVQQLISTAGQAAKAHASIGREVQTTSERQRSHEHSRAGGASRAIAEKEIAAAVERQVSQYRVLHTAQNEARAAVVARLNQERLITEELRKQATEVNRSVTGRGGILPTIYRPAAPSITGAGSVPRSEPVTPPRRPTQPRGMDAADMAYAAGQRALAESKLRLAKEEHLTQKQIREEHQKTAVVLSEQIRSMEQQVTLNDRQTRQLLQMYQQKARELSLGKEKGGFFGLGTVGGKAGEGSGFLGGLFEGGASKLAGTIGFAVLSAEGLGRAIAGLSEKMKAFLEETGPLIAIREQFEKLAEATGKDPGQFFDKLRGATHGLVDDLELYRTANAFMQSGLHVSQDQVVQLTQATQGLARAQGRDASQALEALTSYFRTGYARELERATGLTRDQIGAMGGMGRGAEGASRGLLGFQQIFKAVTTQYEAIGEPQLTYAERLKQLDQAQKRFFEGLVQGVQKSRVFQEFLKIIGALADKISGWADKAEDFGKRFADAFAFLQPTIEQDRAIFSDLWAVVKDVVEVFSKLVGVVSILGKIQEVIVSGVIAPIVGWTKASDALQGRFSTLSGVIATFLEIVESLGSGVRLVADTATLAFNELMLSAKLAWDTVFHPTKIGADIEAENQSLKEYIAKVKEGNKELTDQFARAEAIRKKGLGPSPDKFAIRPFSIVTPGPQQSQLEELQHAEQMAKLYEEIAVKKSKMELDQTEARIKVEEELVQQEYDQGLLQFSDYLTQKRNLEAEDHAARLKNIDDEWKAKQKANAAENQITTLTAKMALDQAKDTAKQESDQREVELKSRQADIQKQNLQPLDYLKAQNDLQAKYDAAGQAIKQKLDTAQKLYTQQLAGVRAKDQINNLEHNDNITKANEEAIDKELKDRQEANSVEQAAYRKSEQSVLALTKERISQQESLLEDSFSRQNISAEKYTEQRIALIQQLYTAEVTEANQAADFAKDNDEAKAVRDEAIAKAAMDREKALTDLQIHEIERRNQATEGVFNSAKAVFQGQLSGAQAEEEAEGAGATRGEQISIIQNMIELETKRLDIEEKIASQIQSDNKAWLDQQQKIAATREEIVKLNEQLVHQRDYMSSIGSILGQMAEGFGYANKKISSGLGEAARGLETFAKIHEELEKRQATLTLQRAGSTPEQRARAEKILGAAPKTPQEQAQAIFGALDTVTKETGKGLVDLQNALDAAKSETVKSFNIVTSSVDRLASASDAAAKSVQEYGDAIASGKGVPGAAKTTATLDVPTVPQHASGIFRVEQAGTKFLDANEAVLPTFVLTQLAAIVKTLTQTFDNLNSTVSQFVKGMSGAAGGASAGLPAPGRIGATSPLSIFSSLGLAPSVGASGLATAASPLGTMTASDQAAVQASAKSGPFLDAGDTSVPNSMQEFATVTSQAATSVQQLSGSASTASSSLKAGLNNLFGNGPGGLATLFKEGTSGLKGAFSSDPTQQGEADSNLQAFSKGVAQLTQEVGGLVSAARGQGGPVQAGFTGMMSGAELGSNFGTAGMLIGGGIGLVTGIFAGKALQESQKIAKDIGAQFNATLNEISGGTKALAQGITDEIQTIQTAVSQLSGMKGGRQELNALLPQMEQSLQQLQQQQQQVLTGFDQQLEVLSSPTAYQQTISGIQQIIQQYQQYVNAGGNVAQANEFLQLSFQQLAQNGYNQLNQNEQDAINNALNYNNLLLQRQQLIQSTNEQIQQIMSQGVAVRQMPTGVTKAVQIEQLMQNSQNQLAQMDQQISVSGYQLQVQQQIFSLATTRIGLETQLVQLQDAQTNQQMQQVAELQSVVTAFSQGVPTSNLAAMQQLGLGPAYISPAQEPAMAPIPPVKTGIQAIDLQNQQEYNQALEYYNQQLNQTANYLGAIGTNAQGVGMTGMGTPGQYYPTSTVMPVTAALGEGTTGSMSAYGSSSNVSTLVSALNLPANPANLTNQQKAVLIMGMSGAMGGGIPGLTGQQTTQAIQQYMSGAPVYSTAGTTGGTYNPTNYNPYGPYTGSTGFTSQPTWLQTATPTSSGIVTGLVPGSAAAAAVPPAGPMPWNQQLNTMGVTFSGAAMTPEQVAALGFGITPYTGPITSPIVTSRGPGAATTGLGEMYSSANPSLTTNNQQIDTIESAYGTALLTATVPAETATGGEAGGLGTSPLTSTTGIPGSAIGGQSQAAVLLQNTSTANPMPYGAAPSFYTPGTIPMGAGLPYPTTVAGLQSLIPSNATAVSAGGQGLLSAIPELTAVNTNPSQLYGPGQAPPASNTGFLTGQTFSTSVGSPTVAAPSASNLQLVGWYGVNGGSFIWQDTSTGALYDQQGNPVAPTTPYIAYSPQAGQMPTPPSIGGSTLSTGLSNVLGVPSSSPVPPINASNMTGLHAIGTFFNPGTGQIYPAGDYPNGGQLPTIGATSPYNGSAMPTSAAVSAQAQISTQSLGIEQQISTLVNTRVNSESQLLSQKMQVIQAETQLEQLKQQNRSASGSTSLESMFNQAYNVRARYGSGGFYGEVSNST